MPKGVVWRHEDIFFAALGGGDPTQMEGPIASPGDLPGRIPDVGGVMMQTPPLMHVSAHWGALQSLFGGGTAVLANYEEAKIRHFHHLYEKWLGLSA